MTESQPGKPEPSTPDIKRVGRRSPWHVRGLPERESRPTRLSSLSLTAGLLMLVAVAASLGGQLLLGTETIAGVVLIPVLAGVASPLIRRAARAERSFDLAGILWMALSLKFVAAFMRLAVLEELYGGAGDSNYYSLFGARYAESFRSLDFAVKTNGPWPGTGFIEYMTGLVYAVTGVQKFAAFLIFAFASFWGAFFFYRAFETAIPNGSHRRYALLVLLWPSMVFWPASIGKEAWMVPALGLASWGAARILVSQRGGFIMLGAGLWAASMVRPHVALLLFVGFVIAYILRRAPKGAPGQMSMAGFARIVGVLALLVVGGILGPRTEKFLELGDLGSQSIDTQLQETQQQTGQGGSAFSPANAQSPIGYPVAFITVLYRPFPFEANNAQSLVLSLEGLVLIGLTVTSWRRFLSIPRLLRKQAYTALAVSYILMFVLVFSALANFGILTRQRAQVLPFVFVLLALPAWKARPRATRPRNEPPTRRSTPHDGT